MSYVQSALDGNVAGMLRFAILSGSLWAVGSAWSTAIRAVVLELLPDSLGSAVGAELLAAACTTALAVGVSYAATRRCCERRIQKSVAETPPPLQVQPHRNRV